MSKKYEEMTSEELGEKANEILKRFREDIYGNSGATIYLKNITDLQKVINIMKDCEKEKVIMILDTFFDKNKDYAIEIYVRNINTRSIIGYIVVSNERKWISNEEKQYEVSWNNEYGKYTIPYDEVLDCYEETDEYGSQTVHVILKCGVSIEFECVGMVI